MYLILFSVHIHFLNENILFHVLKIFTCIYCKSVEMGVSALVLQHPVCL